MKKDIDLNAEVATAIRKVFEQQQRLRLHKGHNSYADRLDLLARLESGIWKYRARFKEAMFNDWSKNATEVDLTELFPVLSEIRLMRGNLRRWMAPQRVSAPLTLIGSRGRVQHQPKGVVLIIAPWNYPINLTLIPLVSALAAGNSVILKPSELTPHTAAVLGEMITEVFKPTEVALFEGGVALSQELLQLPFNHIFFTGSPRVGKLVMAAAAKNLASVTLELGGKSPVIIDESANLKRAASQVAWGKLLNKGQICIAPDYCLVHENVKDRFLEQLQEEMQKLYGTDPSNSNDYARIVNEGHFERLSGAIEDAVSRGAKLEWGGKQNQNQRYLAPTVLSDVPPDTQVLKEEIFGPILPIVPFSNLQEAVQYVQQGEPPLALYLFTSKKDNIRQVMNNTRSGALSVNQLIAHFAHAGLPFGGVNNSGIGKSHGYYGFLAFSNARAYFRQRTPFGVADLLKPPYTAWKQRMVDLAMRWF